MSANVGDYALFLEEVTTNPSSSIDTPTELTLFTPAPGKLDTRREAHYFLFDFPEHTYLSILAEVPSPP